MNSSLKYAAAGFALAGALVLDPLSAAMKPGEYLNGQWATEGDRGITFTYLPKEDGSGTLFGAVFGYDNAGEDAWLIVQGDFLENQFTADADVFVFEGGTFANPPFAASRADVGDATFTLNSCGSVDVSFDFDEAASDLPDVTWELEPLGDAVGLPQGTQCVYEQPFEGCPDFATGELPGERTCTVSGAILNDEITLTNNATWALDGLLEIGAPATDSSTLNIEPGTVITSVPDTQNTFIYVHPGSKIYADGTPNAPIVLTSPFDGFNAADRAPVPQDTGGLVVAGLAPCNTAPNTELGCESEFATGDQILTHGGTDPNDNSGSISYFQIRYAGIFVGDNREVNSFTFLSVGRKTNLHHLQAYNSFDDGFEMFGGTANMSHIVATDGADDNVDWDEGWDGQIQFGLIANADTTGGGSGFEGSNNPQNLDAEPRATPVFSNFTLTRTANEDERAYRLKEGSGGQVWNSVALGYADCVSIEDQATIDAAGTPASPSGTIAFAGNVFNCANNFAGDDSTFSENLVNAFPANLTSDPMLDPATLQPTAGSPALENAVQVFDLSDDEANQFFQFVPYSGAFDEDTNWTEGWTFDPLGVVRQ